MDYIVFARNARGVQGLRASRRARLDCPARDNRMPMQVPAGAEGASAAEGRAGALAPSAPAGTLIAMQLSRAGQSNLARLLARKPWTPRAFHAKGIKSTGTPHFAPSAKFQLILQVFPTEVCKGFASKCPGGQIDLYKTGHINLLLGLRLD